MPVKGLQIIVGAATATKTNDEDGVDWDASSSIGWPSVNDSGAMVKSIFKSLELWGIGSLPGPLEVDATPAAAAAGAAAVEPEEDLASVVVIGGFSDEEIFELCACRRVGSNCCLALSWSPDVKQENVSMLRSPMFRPLSLLPAIQFAVNSLFDFSWVLLAGSYGFTSLEEMLHQQPEQANAHLARTAHAWMNAKRIAPLSFLVQHPPGISSDRRGMVGLLGVMRTAEDAVASSPLKLEGLQVLVESEIEIFNTFPGISGPVARRYLSMCNEAFDPIDETPAFLYRVDQSSRPVERGCGRWILGPAGSGRCVPVLLLPDLPRPVALLAMQLHNVTVLFALAEDREEEGVYDCGDRDVPLEAASGGIRRDATPVPGGHDENLRSSSLESCACTVARQLGKPLNAALAVVQTDLLSWWPVGRGSHKQSSISMLWQDDAALHSGLEWSSSQWGKRNNCQRCGGRLVPAMSLELWSVQVTSWSERLLSLVSLEAMDNRVTVQLGNTWLHGRHSNYRRIIATGKGGAPPTQSFHQDLSDAIHRKLTKKISVH